MDQTLQERLHLVLEQQRAAFRAEMAPSREVRLDRLERVRRMTAQHSEALVKAISADFGHRARQETLLADIFTVESGARHAQKHLRDWMRPRRQPTALHFQPARNLLMRQPLGVVGVVAPWNYPYYLALGPAVGALAAGNRVMIKPSELTPRTGELMAAMVAEFFAPEEMTVVNGEAELARAFTALPFDHLCFTGSTAVGRHRGASRRATPDPGDAGAGRQDRPALVDRSCHLQADGRAAWRYGKLLNAGQTCVAPDYLLGAASEHGRAAGASDPAAPCARCSPRWKAMPTTPISPRRTPSAPGLQGLLDDARATWRHACMPSATKEKTAERPRASRRSLLLDVSDADDGDAAKKSSARCCPSCPMTEVDEALAYINRHEQARWPCIGSAKTAAMQQRVMEPKPCRRRHHQ